MAGLEQFYYSCFVSGMNPAVYSEPFFAAVRFPRFIPGRDVDDGAAEEP